MINRICLAIWTSRCMWQLARDIEMKRAMVDAGSSLTVTLLSVLETTKVSRDRTIKQPIEVSCSRYFHSTLSSTLLELTVGPIRTMNRFHVMKLVLPIIWC